MLMDWEVIIVGAGPAGATLGYELGRMGMRTLILEKEKFPRYKACGGGLNIKTVRNLDFDISPIIEDTIYGAHITFRMNKQFTNRFERPIALTVSRERFDHLLLQKTIESGCTVHEEEKVESVQIREDGVYVHSSRQTYLGELVVGADGTNSIIAKSTGLMQDASLYVGIESEVEVDAVDLERWRNFVLLDLASVQNGYGWIFPKLDHLSIGVWGPLTCSKELKGYYEKFTEKWKGSMKKYGLIKKRGHRLPVRRKDARIQEERVLLVGDAAGLIDPLSGEGIYYAIKSAQLAAEIVKDHLENPQGTPLSIYQALVDQELMVEIRRARALLRLFNLYPRLFVNVLKSSGRLWRAAGELLRGEKTYVDIGKKLGPFEFILDRIGW